MRLFFLGCFFLILLVAAGSIIRTSIRNGIVPMPTSRKVKRGFFNALPQGFAGTAYELGAGWGTLAFPFATQHPHCTIVAVENSWVPYLFLRLRQLACTRKNLIIKRGDIYQIPLQEADLIICYLYPGAMQKLKKKFQEELATGTLIASHTFSIPGWAPLYTKIVDDLYHTPIYIYKFQR